MTNHNPTQPPVPPQQGGQVPPAPSGVPAQGVPQRPAAPAQPGQHPGVSHGATQGHIPTAQHPTMPMPQQGMPGQVPQPQYSGPQQQYPGQPSQAQQPHPWNQQPASAVNETASKIKDESKSFFKRLFDLSFNETVTLSVAKVIYVIALIFIWGGAILLVLFTLGAAFSAAQFAGSFGVYGGDVATGGIIWALFMIPVAFLIALLLTIATRVWMEMAIGLIMTARNTRQLVVLMERAEERDLRKQK